MVRGALAFSLALALLGAGCDLSYNNSCFTCDGGAPCPSGLSCINGYCQTASGNCGSTTGGGTTTGGTATGGTTGAAICTNPTAGLCPPGANTTWLACQYGCCPPAQPYACGQTALCYASPEQAFLDCGGDAGQGCSTCESSWCGSPPDVMTCAGGEIYCGSGFCCGPTVPWFCNYNDGGGGCYATQADALAICGNSCAYCSAPCATSITNHLCGDAGVTCGNACCDPSTPFYCAVNASSGFCFVSNAEATKFCQGSGIACTACVP